MYVDRFKQGNGAYRKEPDGVEYGRAEDFIWNELFGFCGCGPVDRLELVRKGLLHLKKRHDFWNSEDSEKLSDDDFYKQTEYFFYYWASKESLEEHGGSVPGWLTEYGSGILADLTELHGQQELSTQ